MRRSSQTLIAILFPLLLAAYPLSVVLPVVPAEIENQPIEIPDLGFDRITSPSMYVELLNYVRSASPFRALLIRTVANIDFQLFGDSPDPSRVLRGTDGWLYFRPTLENGCVESPTTVVNNVVNWLDRLESAGTTVVFTVAPSKFIVVPEHLTPDQAELGACSKENGGRLRSLLGSARITHYVDSWDIFEELKREAVQPYFETDTHFNFVGSVRWIEALIEEIDTEIWDPSQVNDIGDTQWLGNLTSFAGLDQPEQVRHVVIDRQVTVDEIAMDERMAFFRVSGPDRTIPGKTLILGDSFMELPRESIIQFFEDVAVLDWRQESSIDHFLENAASSDFIIVEVSELDIWDRFGHGPVLMDQETRG